MAIRPLTGLFPPELVARREFPRLAPAVVAGAHALGDLTGNLSDAMDELGLPSGVPRLPLRPNLAGRIVGQAVTLRNEPNDRADPASARPPGRRLGDVECYNLAEPGDVLVIQGVDGVSSMGGISAAIGRRAGLAGAVVAGAVRDVVAAREVGFPTWASGSTPASGKFRLHTAEIMGPVTIGGVPVDPGDLVAADETGVCFVPYAEAARVLERAQTIASREAARLSRIEAEIPGRLESTEH